MNSNSIKIWHISDTHTYHDLLSIPKDIDLVIHSGDISIPRDIIKSEQECLAFIDWYSKLDIPHKILIAGNHDIAIERRRVSPGDIASKGIIYLENSSTTIKGLKIWGSPITPSFGEGWAFNKKRDKIHDVWSMIPEDTDIIVTHGPVKGILDHSYNKIGNVYERCGCKALKTRVLQINPKLICFGHIHSTEDIINAGIVQLSGLSTIYSNGSVVTDGKFGQLSSNGNIINISI